MPDTLHVTLAVAQTLSFALPSPAGPAVAAGIQLLDMLSPKQSGPDPTKILMDRMTEVTQEIKTFLAEQKLDDVAADLETIKDFVSTASTLVTSNEDEDVLRIHYQDALASIQTSLMLHNFIEMDLEKLPRIHGSGDGGYAIGCTAVQLYLNMLMSYICLLKLRCEYANRLVDLATQTDGGAPKELIDEVFAKLDDFWVKLNYWTIGEKLTNLTNWCAKIKSDRLSLIGDVQTGGEDSVNIFTQEVTGLAYEYFMDGSKEGGRQNHTWKWVMKQVGRRRDKKVQFSDSRATAEGDRREYYSAQQRQADIDFAYVTGTIGKIREQADQLNKPVAAPSTVPTLAMRDTQWDDAWKWPSGTKVCYGIGFANSHQSSEVKWTDMADALPGRTCPYLAKLPVDAVGSTTVRHIYRKVLAPNSGATSPTLCASLSENTTTEFVDIDPSDWSKVCPNALSPPVIKSWERHYRAANTADADARSWAPGYKVRYRYVFLTKAGQSLFTSAWSQSSPDIGSIDGEGYCTGKDGGYLAELQIPRDQKGKATGCKVYRQFKGKAETEFSSGAEISGRYFVFRDASL